ncbi:BMP family ABC transporter substrate-binding protein [Candidatus Bipolaricaulota bacterium]|nr:BMP family ABC transporter substrate-binding protein [Candidatus Bipolaricaulota bacterium]
MVFIILSLILVGFSSTVVAQDKKLKAGFIYVGPVGDYGYTKSHDVGREYVEEMFPWLETFIAENVQAPDVESTIDQFVNNRDADVIFTTSFSHMQGTISAAEDHPDTLFFHCSGVQRRKNVGTYFSGLYQLYYLNGLMAGALTESDKLGYVAAIPNSEVKRHINSFAIGVKEVNPDATVHVRWLNTWFDPPAAKEATQSLLEIGADGFAFTEDSPTVLQTAQENGAFSFSHYNPMYRFAKEGTLSGQLTNRGVIYADILYKVYYGIYTSNNLKNVDYWWLLKEGAVELGAKRGMKINPDYIDELKSKTVEVPYLGKISVYDLVMKRLKQMKSDRVTFDPFIGPIKDREGVLRLKDGEWATHDELWTMEWAYENIKGPWPGEPKE